MSVMLAGCALALASCGGGADSGAEQAGESKAADPAGNAKLKGYVSAYNVLIGTPYGGLQEAADAYAAYHVERADPSKTIGLTFQTDARQRTLDELTKARAATGNADTAAVDRAADQLIPPLKKIVELQRELGPYYSSRAYRNDGLARGKALDVELKAAFAEALTALKTMGAALDESQARANAALIARLRADGHVAEASLTNAIQAGSPMIAALARDDDAAADRLFAPFQQAVEQMRADQPKLKNLGNDISYASILDQLTQVTGLYSDYKNGDAAAKQRLIGLYNQAVSTANRFPIPR